MSWDADVRQIRMNFKYTLNKTICYQLDSLLQPNCIFNLEMDQEWTKKIMNFSSNLYFLKTTLLRDGEAVDSCSPSVAIIGHHLS